jgi:excisionase family DNA binding protein
MSRGGVYVPAESCNWAGRQLLQAIEVVRRNGGRVPSAVPVLVDELLAAGRAAAMTDKSPVSWQSTVLPESLTPEEIGTAEAAGLLGFEQQRSVTRLIDQEKIRARKVGRTWLVERESVAEYAKRRC